VEALRASPLLVRINSKYGDAFSPHHNHPGNVVLSIKPAGGCVFLEEPDAAGCQLCAIHKELDYQTKPTSCKNFPFLVVESPDDIRVGASFYCRAVQQNVGRPLSEHTDVVGEFPPERRLRVGFWPIKLFKEKTLDWEGYKVLMDFLGDGGGLLEDYDTLCAQALQALCRVVIDHPASGDGQIAAATVRRSLALQRRDMRSYHWYEMQSSMSLHATTMFIEGRSNAEVKILGASLFAGERVTLPTSLWEGEVAELLAFRLEPLPKALQLEVNRYLRAILFRHYLGTHGPVLTSLVTLFFTSTLIRQFIRISAAVAHEPIDRKHLYLAFDLCEYNLMLHGYGFANLWTDFADGFLDQLRLPQEV
jgi:hypothetical protein